MKKKLLSFWRQFTWIDWILIVLFLLSLTYLAFFGWSRLPPRSVPVEYIAGDSNDVSIWVDVAGAVTNPGVYQLTPGARVKDAIVAAGGVTEAASGEYLARVINLAAPVKDGEKIYVVPEGEVKSTSSSLINVNTASLVELDVLPGIGAVRAEDIVKNRPYRTVEELVAKGVITKAIFEKIKGKISVF